MPAAGTPDDNFHDAFADNNLTDDDLESEIELVSELVVAATSSDRPLDQDEVDALLGVYVNKKDKTAQSES
ncbi:MAG: hypothetical protein QOE58_2853 [Actinomycetota bacterium]|jgi:predicted RNase H-like nuclease|nr:hypothetical protein [Actinomycetota bacterium]